MMFKRSIFALLFVFMFFSGNLFAQLAPRVLFAHHHKPANIEKDSLLVKHLEENYEVTLIDHSEFEYWTSDSTLQHYDLLFISESAGSWQLQQLSQNAGIRTIPIPIVMTEGFATRASILGWMSSDSEGFGTIEDSMLAAGGNKVIITDNTGHDLSAGFAENAEVALVSAAGDGNETLTFTTPEIDHIPIAVAYVNTEQTVIMGVEAGTDVWNPTGTVLEPSDTTTTKNRAALVGFHHWAHPYITEDGFKLIDAAMTWALDTEKKDLLFAHHHKPVNIAKDSLLVQHLRNTFDVTPVDHSEFEYWTSDSTLQHYDIFFISESAGSWQLQQLSKNAGIRTIPIPMVLTEGFATRASILGWMSSDSEGFGTIEDSMLAAGGNKVIITDATGHDLSAGFAENAEVALVSATGDGNETLTFTTPEIDHIPIAVAYVNTEQTVIMGVEAGTDVWNPTGTVLEPSDTTTTKNRASLVGFHHRAHPYITEDGYKLIDAGIEWVLTEGANAIGDMNAGTPNEFKLGQNYPNPFNPSTEIAFTLGQPSHTTLTIFNVLGQKVASLLDAPMAQGTHKVTFNAVNLTTGVYFYQLKTEYFTQVKKMMLMK